MMKTKFAGEATFAQTSVQMPYAGILMENAYGKISDPVAKFNYDTISVPPVRFGTKCDNVQWARKMRLYFKIFDATSLNYAIFCAKLHVATRAALIYHLRIPLILFLLI